MAQATRALRGCIAARTISGNSPQILYIPQGRDAARQWDDTALTAGVAADTGTSTGMPKAGAMVYMNSTRVLECWPGAMVATGYDTIQYLLLGLLLEDCSAEVTGLRKVAVAIANNDTIFETALMSQTATTTATVTASLIGYRVSASCNGSRFYLDRTTDAPTFVGSEQFRIVDVLDADGTWHGRVLFQPRRGFFINDTREI